MLDGELGACNGSRDFCSWPIGFGQPNYFGLVIRDIGSRGRESEEAFSVATLLDRSPEASLESLVRSSH